MLLSQPRHRYNPCEGRVGRKGTVMNLDKLYREPSFVRSRAMMDFSFFIAGIPGRIRSPIPVINWLKSIIAPGDHSTARAHGSKRVRSAINCEATLQMRRVCTAQ